MIMDNEVDDDTAATVVLMTKRSYALKSKT